MKKRSALDDPFMTVHRPDNQGQRIDSVWVFISSDETGEGVVAAPILPGLGSMPLIAADEARLDSLRPIAASIAKALKVKIKLIKLTTREEVEEFGP